MCTDAGRCALSQVTFIVAPSACKSLPSKPTDDNGASSSRRGRDNADRRSGGGGGNAEPRRSVRAWSQRRGDGESRQLDGALPTIKDFNRRISYHARRLEFEAASEVKCMIEAAEVLETGIRRNVYTYNAWLDACVRCGRMELTSTAMQEMLLMGLMPNTVSFNTVLKGYSTGRKSDLDRALKLFRDMSQHGVKADAFSYNTLLNACAMAGEMDTARSLFAQMLDDADVLPDDFTVTTLAKGWGGVGRAEELDKLVLFKLNMEADDLHSAAPRSPTAYNALADAYVRCGRPRKAVMLIRNILPDDERDECGVAEGSAALLNEMKRRAEQAAATETAAAAAAARDPFSILKGFCVRPDVNTFNVLLKALRQSGAMSPTSLAVLEKMDALHIAPDAITFLVVVDNLCTNGNFALAHKTFDDMRARGVEPDASVYNALIKGYARQQQPDTERVLELYGKMLRGDDGFCAPDHVTSACVVDALARVGDVERALRVLEDAERVGGMARPRRETFNAVIKAHRTALLLELRRMDADSDADIPPPADDEALPRRASPRSRGPPAFDENTPRPPQLLQHFVKARRVLNRMHGFADERKRPDVVTYNTLIDMCAELGDVGGAARLYDDMIQVKIAPDVTTFNTLIKTNNRLRLGLMAAYEWTKEMAKHGVRADQFTYAALLSASAESKDVPRALEFFQATLHAKQRELALNREEDEPELHLAVHPSAYISLMKAFSNLGVAGSQMIFRLRDELNARGCEMGVSGYTAVANCYAQQGDYEAVNATFDEMLRKTKNVTESLNLRQQSIRIKAYCKGDDIDEALRLFLELSSRDVALYNTLLACCLEAGRMEEVQIILEQMQLDGVDPASITSVSVKDMMKVVATSLRSLDRRVGRSIQRAAAEPSLPPPSDSPPPSP